MKDDKLAIVHKKSFKAYIKKHQLEDKLTTDSECSICLEKFQMSDKIQGLKCSVLHIFHKKCIDKLKS